MLPLALIAALGLPVTACVSNQSSPDDINSVGVGGGKADGEEFSDCELDAVVVYLNSGPSAEQLAEAGVHTAAANSLAAHLAGEDGEPGTEDDNTFENIAAVDEIDFVGPVAMQQLVAIVADECVVEVDPYEQARDVTLAHITFPEDMEAPTSYVYPRAEGFSLSGTEFWQKWSGGHSPTYSFSEGTDFGRRCMQAAAIRYETIMATAPEELTRLKEETNWGGSFFNWNDDYSLSEWSDASAPRLWAWRTGLIKWISQTAKDGSCYLPTLELVKQVAVNCLDRAETNGDREIQGCSAR